MPGPSITFNAEGNALAAQALAASAAVSASPVDFSVASYGGWIQAKAITGGTVAATNGLRIDVYPAGDSVPDYDTIPLMSYSLSGFVASTTYRKSVQLPIGKFKVTLTNLDVTNGLTTVLLSSAGIA